MATNKLNDKLLRALKPTGAAQKFFDGGGLYLALTPAGSKHWRLAYRLDGKAQTKSLGAWPEVSLAAARAAREQFKAAPAPGAPGQLTLQAACQKYWAGRRDLSPGYVSNALRAMEMHLWPALGERLLGSITREDLLGPMRLMDARGLHVYVRRTRMWVSQVFEWGLEQGECQANPAALIKPERAFGARPVEHFAAVPLREVHAMMARVALEGDLQSVLAFQLLALTWVRTTELRAMRWQEIEGDLWRVPAERMKRRREHLVPLSRQAVELLAKVRSWGLAGDLVWPGGRDRKRPISENAILALLARCDYGGRHTGHGWRTVGSTWANERGYPVDAIERQLAHAPDDKVRAAYNRAEFMPERRAMLQAWADWLLP